MNVFFPYSHVFLTIFLIPSISLVITSQAKILLLSLDGFRWDYVDIYKDEFPNLRRLIGEGSTIEGGLYPSWVTSTFSSHRTLFTGLYPESHGIVGNTFWAPDVNDVFKKWKNDFKFWNWAEPIWHVAEKQGVTAGCISIVGCDVVEQKPTHAISFTKDLSLEQFTDKAISMFKESADNKKPAEAVFYYYWEPDSSGHRYGPVAEEMKQKMIEVDSAIGYLLDEVKDLNETDGIDLNLIILSDHGLIEVNQTIDILPYVNDSNTDHLINRGNIVHIWNKDPQDFDLLDRIGSLKYKYPKAFEMIPRFKIPENRHFKNSYRCPPILLVAEPGYTFLEESDREKGYQPRGTHGYYPEVPQMRPIFVARGPAFKSNYVHKNSKIQSVDVYPLLAYLMNIKPNKHEGDLSRIIALLKPEVAEAYFIANPAVGASLPNIVASRCILTLICFLYVTLKSLLI